jgi:hypothetical protein
VAPCASFLVIVLVVVVMPAGLPADDWHANDIRPPTRITWPAQMTRWVTTKDAHASNIITTVGEYFLTQKVKPVPKGDAQYQQ